MNTQHVYDVDAPKKPVSVSANSDLVNHAKRAGINLSKTFEEAVAIKLRATLEETWLAENKEAIDAYNDRIEKNGVFAAKQRRF